MKTVTLGEMLTDKQIERSIELAHNLTGTALHKALRDEIIAPNMPEINKRLGQENDPDYLAFAIEYAITQAAKGQA